MPDSASPDTSSAAGRPHVAHPSRPPRWDAYVAVGLALACGVAQPPVWAQATPGGRAQILDASDVRAVITGVAGAIDDDTVAIAVVDRAGSILGVYARPNAAITAPDVAVSSA